jgi:hypothetical protein
MGSRLVRVRRPEQPAQTIALVGGDDRGALVVVGTIANLLTECSSSEPANARELFEGCVSGWDGNHNGLESLIRAQLHDPGSMETHGTYYNSADSIADGEIRIRLDYSAANLFGGKVRKNASARMGTDCQIIAVIDYGS